MKRQYQTFAYIAVLICNFVVYPVCLAQYTLQVNTGQVYQDITNPTYEIPDYSPYFGNVNTKPDMLFKAFGQDYDLYENVFIPIKQGYCYFDNGQRSATLYVCKGNFTKRPGQTSVFSFKTDTTAGNRKFIMQWKNMGFLNGHDTDYINFQIWLYEKDGLIEFRFGANKVRPGLYENGASGPTIGLLDMDAAFSTIYHQLWLKGQASVPQVVNTNGIVTLDQTPANGHVYKFAYDPTGINTTALNRGISLYPNPVSDKLFLKFQQNSIVSSFTILNTLGQDIMHLDNMDERNQVDVSSLSPGIYFLQVSGLHGELNTYKFVKE